ncbi:penicillin-binding protein 2 [bacterium]|nr:penicillin-binding protein 2 [candidate division CSSED10-310 bacterium]
MIKQDSSRQNRRIPWIIVFMTAFIAAICVKLWWLQIVQVDKYRELAQNNRTRLMRDRAQRGRIVDRNGNSLATTRPSFGLYIIPEDFPKTKRNEVFKQLGIILSLPEDMIKEKFFLANSAGFIPRKIASNIPFEKVIQIESKKFDLPGVITRAENTRFYPYGSLACHMLGYVGEISEKQLSSSFFTDYQIGDIVGKTGVESIYEKYLNGKDGYRWVEVDSIGRINRTLRQPAPKLSKPGADIRLTIDLELQKSIEKYLEPWNGCIIVMNPNNGEILAMVSRPEYDPNSFAVGISSEEWNQLNANKDYPLINRPLQVAASPGSVFKVVTAIAALRSNGIDTNTSMFCNGVFRFSNNDFHCWKTGGHGHVALRQAIEGSCNVFFYQAGLKAGIDSIYETAQQFGLGKKTMISLPNERSGFIPNREWKETVKHDAWWPGETISVSIGQGGVLTTPLQLINMMSAIANGGTVYRPKILLNADELGIQDYQTVLNTITFNDDYWTALREGLRDVIWGDHGTARSLKMKEITIAGKTGTAQVISKSALKKLGFSEFDIPEKLRDHNWFVGFAPFDNPQVSVLVFLENGGKEGASRKANIAKQVFLKWQEVFQPAPHVDQMSPTPEDMTND